MNMIALLMLANWLLQPSLLKITAFWNKGCDVITSVHGLINKIVSHDSNYIADVVWPKFGNFSMSLREVIIGSSYKALRSGLDSRSTTLG